MYIGKILISLRKEEASQMSNRNMACEVVYQNIVLSLRTYHKFSYTIHVSTLYSVGNVPLYINDV